ncbi:N-acetylmuramoyl-L-alanine amidase [Castellaniella sp.]|uniref:N-acetylmuramoyl-L-alanine amidase family protein n=1 Tax=Castellaniella sp. TaxID=1955812 RepID=UPI0025B830BB|nr:N-acetylmuramoyl-L-alanine amidase [Castellaniella sp.]
MLLAGCAAQPSPAVRPSLSGSAPAAPIIVLDPGHNPADGGATSVRGTREIGYNDRFVAELAPALRAAGWRVRVTRAPGESISLVGRAQLADELRANLFLSVHHDSVQLRCLRQITKEGRPAFETLRPTGGYSLYVSKENPDFTLSYRFATLLGEQFRSLGRSPMLEHAGTTCGENRPLLDARLGIYQYDHLAVLRHSNVPAVLLEVGVITDAQDESYVNDAGNRRRMIAGIVRAVRVWIAQNETSVRR